MHHRSLSSSVNLEEKFLKWRHFISDITTSVDSESGKKSLFLKDFYIIGLHLLQLQIFDMKTILLPI